MTESKRIILNTSASYGKSIITLPLNLLSARWILQGLGADDFGLQGVVGGIVVFITFVSSVSSQAAARFYAFAIGVEKKSESDGCCEVARWFNTALLVHAVLPFVLISIGYPIGVYAIRHWLVVPPERLMAAVWVFRLSLVTAFFSMLYVPYVALYMAHQLITNLTVFTILASICSATFAYCFAALGGDHLIVYATGSLLIAVLIGGVQVLYAHHRFPSARVSLSLMMDFKRVGQMLSFSWWRLLASAGYVIRTQGSAFIVNINFGVAANAAVNVANQLSSQTAAFSTHLGNALLPAIVTSAGAEQRQHMIDLVFRSCKFGTLLVLFFAIPMICECETVLHLWLGVPPSGASMLCICMIVAFAVDRLTGGYEYALTATGKIAAWQAWETFAHASTLLTGWIFIQCGMSVVSIGYAYILTTVLMGAGRVYFARRLVHIGIPSLFSRVVIPMAACGGLSMGAALICVYVFDMSFSRLCVTTAASMGVLTVSSWWLALDSSERHYCKTQMLKMVNRL